MLRDKIGACDACLDEKNQLLITNIWLSLEWNDYNLKWNESEYGGVKDLRITPNKLWKPDVLMYNSADEGFDGTFQTNVVVKHNGSCLYVPPGIFKSTCKIDITWFPFDDQHCDMKFGSWTYDGNQSQHSPSSSYQSVAATAGRCLCPVIRPSARLAAGVLVFMLE
ncbi:nicotinic acetylcholine receptor subunit alpha6 [Tribolium castaneum]|uniref:Nicotinic acetylcholine receptor subunit alpha6 n=1 Tax=Tribolium castaneum TaxID=7070 RepID=A0A139WP31_TRICA|nr:nicotinic acetylcholine receptor subunit alpha6 [Tribolium castaneum]